MIRGKFALFSRWPLTMASMMLGWSDPRLTKTWLMPASPRDSKKANEVVYMPGGDADEWSALAGGCELFAGGNVSERAGGVLAVVAVVAITPGESSACDGPCRPVLTVALVGEDLDIASDDESLSCCCCCCCCGGEYGAGSQPVVMPFRGAFLGPGVAASELGRSCGARAGARDGIPATRWNWRQPMGPARMRAWPRVRVRAAESDETAASGTEFPLGGLGSGVLRRSIFPGVGGGARDQCTPTLRPGGVGGGRGEGGGSQ